jgi:hypothetical protein
MTTYEIEHTTYTDDMGVKRDNFTCIRYNPDGSRTIKPFNAPIKVTNHSKDKNILDDTNEYTDKDYQEMLDEHEGF